MKLKILYVLFILFSALGCGLAYFQLTVGAVFFRSLCLLILCLIYYRYKGFNNNYFFLGVLISGLGEALLVYGFEIYPISVILCFITYAWVLIFMVKKDNTNVTYRIEKTKLIPLIISVGLVLYLLVSILILITPSLGTSLYYGYFFMVSFFIMAIYIGFVYMEGEEVKYIWLLHFMFAVVISISTTSLEAFYYPSKLFSQIGYLTQIASHFFLLKFFISKGV